MRRRGDTENEKRGRILFYYVTRKKGKKRKESVYLTIKINDGFLFYFLSLFSEKTKSTENLFTEGIYLFIFSKNGIFKITVRF